jgi:two-component system chemotaxis response regulator CheB
VPAHAIVAIGVSTGGPQTLLEILPALPASLPVPVVLVQHMPPKFISSLACRLDAASDLSVKEAEHDETLRAGTVYVAPGGYQMTVVDTMTGSAPTIRLGNRPRGLTFCPSVDVLFNSVALLYGGSAVGVLLTGMGDDGAEGMMAIQRAGGATIAESEESAVVFGMPRVAIERGGADVIVPACRVANRILNALREKSR